MKRIVLCLSILCILLSVPASAARIPIGYIDFVNPYLGVERSAGANAEFTFRVYWLTGDYGWVKTDVQLNGATLTVHFNEGPDLVSSDPSQPWRFPLDLNGNILPTQTLTANRAIPHKSQNVPTQYMSSDAQRSGSQGRTPVGVTLSGTLSNTGQWVYQPGAIATSFVPRSPDFAYRINLPNGWANSRFNYFDVEGVPEPGTLILVTSAFALAFAARRSRKI